MTNRMRRQAIRVTVAIVMIALGAEIGTRIINPAPDLYAVNGRIPAPASILRPDAFCAFTMPPGATRGKTVNTQGFVSTPEIDYGKPPGRCRIVFLGGSSTAGQENGTGDLPDEQTWPWQVTASLRRAGYDVDFLNGALGAYTTFELLGRFWTRLRWYEPDIVVLYNGWNEMLYWTRLDDMAGWRTTPGGGWSPRIGWCRQTRYDFILRRSHILTYIRLAVAIVRHEQARRPGEARNALWRPDRGIDIYRDNLRMIQQAANLMGAKLYVCKQATLITPDASDEQRQRCTQAYRLTGLDHGQQVEVMQRIYAVIDAEIDAGHIIDSTSLSGRLDCFHDAVHPTPLGAEQIAEIVAQAIEPAL